MRLEIEPGEPLPAHVSFGWNHLSPGVQTDAERDLAGTTRNKIAGVLPPRMKCLAELLCLLPPDRLAEFCGRIEIAGSRPLLRQSDADQLVSLARLRLRGDATDTQRHRLRRLLERIDPAVCRPPVDHLDPRLQIGDAVAVSASQVHLNAQVVCVPSAANYPVVGMRGPKGLELADTPSPRELVDRWKWSPTIDGDG